ncbi:MAG: DUF1844 domain-containing protein [Candidatus Omnitrophica bacterium]|nr:DUF1844 domain-containing protein [Candidatus Omnitrophota bacterium]
MDNDKHVDESWKDEVAKVKGEGEACGDDCSCGHDHGQEKGGIPEVNFFNYVMSMGYQAMIFLGEVPHPMTGKTEKNVQQAKFLIDTMVMLRDKTKGNLDAKEEQFLSGTLYELQMKFVEVSKKESTGIIS